MGQATAWVNFQPQVAGVHGRLDQASARQCKAVSKILQQWRHIGLEDEVWKIYAPISTRSLAGATTTVQGSWSQERSVGRKPQSFGSKVRVALYFQWVEHSTAHGCIARGVSRCY